MIPFNEILPHKMAGLNRLRRKVIQTDHILRRSEKPHFSVPIFKPDFHTTDLTGPLPTCEKRGDPEYVGAILHPGVRTKTWTF
jgi:hypothetical protein